MNAAEAMTRLIDVSDRYLKINELSEDINDIEKENDEIRTAAAVCMAMLNTFLPIARFRCHVEVTSSGKSAPGKAKLAATSEFTSCSASMDGIRSSLAALSSVETDVRVTIFEQRATGADMLSGYQGLTKTQNYRRFLEGLNALETLPTVQ